MLIWKAWMHGLMLIDLKENPEFPSSVNEQIGGERLPEIESRIFGLA